MIRFLPGILAMAAIVVASNVLVQFTVATWLTWGPSPIRWPSWSRTS